MAPSARVAPLAALAALAATAARPLRPTRGPPRASPTAPWQRVMRTVLLLATGTQVHGATPSGGAHAVNGGPHAATAHASATWRCALDAAAARACLNTANASARQSCGTSAPGRATGEASNTPSAADQAPVTPTRPTRASPGGEQGAAAATFDTPRAKAKALPRAQMQRKFLVVNVGGIRPTVRGAGAAQGTPDTGAELSWMPNGPFTSLLRTLQEHDNGVSRYVLAVLTETQLRGRCEIDWAMAQLTAIGYQHVEAHGAAGIDRERGGVVVAWRPEKLHVRPFAATAARPTRAKRVVTRGRILQIRFALGRGNADHDIDLLACYMPTHAPGAEAKAEIQKAWRRLTTAAVASARLGGRLVVAGDLNAATAEDRPHHRRPGDLGLGSLLHGVQGLTRLTPRGHTFYVDGAAVSTIDHLLALPTAARHLQRVKLAPGPEELAQRARYHKAITGELESADDTVPDSEQRRVSGRLCDRRADEHHWASCIRRFHYLLPQVYRAGLRRQRVAIQWHLRLPAADGSYFDWSALERDHGDSADNALHGAANFDWAAP